MEQSYRAAGVPVIALRAGNFIAPGRDDDFMAVVALRSIRKGKITSAGGAEVMQAYCFLPDWARAAVMLAERRKTLPVFADIPFPGHAFTTKDLRAAMERLSGRRLTLTGFPWWLMTLAAPFWELAREMKEMRYLYHTDHRLDGALLARFLPEFEPTPLEVVFAASLPADIRPDQPVRTSGKAIAAE
jgi:nucleoside-diphosphate-sugar epimerase